VGRPHTRKYKSIKQTKVLVKWQGVFIILPMLCISLGVILTIIRPLIVNFMFQIRKVHLNQCGRAVYYSLSIVYLTVLLEFAECSIRVLRLLSRILRVKREP